MNTLEWSPDGSRIAVSQADSDLKLGSYQLAVIDVSTGAIHLLLAQPCVVSTSESCQLTLAWSPDGRYLAFSRSALYGNASPVTTLWLWDAGSGHIRALSQQFSVNISAAVWAHDSRRLAITSGPADWMAMPPKNPALEVIIVTSGHSVELASEGTPDSWSPDDRFLAAHYLTPQGLGCTDNGCFGLSFLASPSGGPLVSLGSYDSAIDNNQWTAQRGGYTYDQWLLDTKGHIRRAIAAFSPAVLSWSPDGRYALVQTEIPGPVVGGTSDTSPAQLALVSLSGSRIILENDKVHATYLGVRLERYVTGWDQNGTAFAFSSPFISKPNLRIGSVGSNGSIHVGSVFIAGSPIGPLQFTADGRYLLAASRRSQDANLDVYRYSIATHSLTLLTTGAADFGLQPAAPRPQPPADLIAAIEHLRLTTDQDLTILRGGEEQRAQAVLYFQQHLGTDAASGIATVLLDALSVKDAVKLWQGPLHDFIANMSLTNTKALLKQAAKDTGKGFAKKWAKKGYDAATAALIDWLIHADPRATQAFDDQITLDQQQLNAAASQAEATLRAHPPTAAAATLLLAQLKSVTNANLALALQLDASSNLLISSYYLRSGADQDSTIFDNFFADTALYWGLTALSIPVGGWGGLAYEATKTAFHSLQTLGKVTQDAQMDTVGAATALSAIVLARQVTANAGTLIANSQKGTGKATPTGQVLKLTGNEQAARRRGATQISQATLVVTLRDTSAVAAKYQAVVTYQHTHYTLPIIAQGAYPVEYLAKSPEAHIGAGKQGALTVDFLIGGSGTPPSDGTPGQIEIIAQSQGLTYLVAKQFFTWQPHAS